MRIASYNIRKAVGLDWRRNPERIVEVLAEMDADVVVLQEADKRVGQRAGVLPADVLARDLGYSFANLSVRPHSHGWHGNAILYRNHTLELDAVTRIDLPTHEPRGAVSARFQAPSLEVIGVHLALGRAIRRKQLAALERTVKTASHPVLIAGDFNAWKQDADSVKILGEDVTMIAPGHSFHASRPIASLDRFALKGAVRGVTSRVHRSKLAAKASDHLPIIIELEFPEGAA